MNYSDYKDLYDTGDYQYSSDDRYGPALSGIASFLIPGLGQCISGEIGRGLCFAGAELVSTVLFYYALSKSSLLFEHQVGKIGSDGSSQLAIGALACMVLVDIWSIIDATQVAKIKNMYLRDMRGLSATMEINVVPYFAFTPQNGNNELQPTSGLSIKLRF